MPIHWLTQRMDTLTICALSGMEITYAQNYKHNIQIKRVLEAIYTTYNGDRNV